MDDTTTERASREVQVPRTHHGTVIVACTPYTKPDYRTAETVSVNLCPLDHGFGVSFIGYPEDVRRVLTEALAALDDIAAEVGQVVA